MFRDAQLKWRSHSTTALPLLVVLAAFLAAQAYLLAIHDFPLLRSEDVGYLSQAERGWLVVDPFHGPGFPWAIRLVCMLSPLSWLRSAQVVSMASGVVLTVVTYLFARRTASRPIAALAGALTAFSPVVFASSCLLMSDALAGALVWSSLLLITHESRRPIGSFAVAGGLLAGAYLTRSVCVVAALSPVVVLLGRPRTTHWVKRGAAFYGTFALVALPWLIVRWVERGNPFFDHNHLNIAFNMHRAGKGWNVFPTVKEYPNLGAVIRSDPRLFLEAWGRNLIALPRQFLELVPIAGVTLGVLGGVLWLRAISAKGLAIVGFCVAYAFAVALTWYEPRFLLPLVPLLALWIARGLQAIPGRFLSNAWPTLADDRVTRAARVLAAALALAATCHELRAIPREWLREQPDEYRKAAAWIRRHKTSRRTVIMSAKAHIPFYARGTPAKFRDADLQNTKADGLEAVLRKVKPTYFVYDARYARRQFPQFAHLLKPSDRTSHFLKPVYSIEKPQRLVIYEYVDPS